FLAFEPAEESFHAFPARAVAVDDEPLLVVGEVRPRHVEADASARRALEVDELRAVVRLAPGLDRVLLDRFRRIGDDQIHVQLDDVAESVTDRARAERVVEREEARLRDLVLEIALATFEAFGKAMHALVRD